MGVSTLRAVRSFAPLRMTKNLVTALPSFAADIKLAHSIFALPFAASTFFLIDLPLPSAIQSVLLLICMVTARSFAMGMNRLLDWQIDLANPRTRVRQIPSGKLKPWQAALFCAASAATFVACAFGLSRLAGYCSVPLLVILMSYSLLKRYTWIVHWYLGVCLGLAPVAVEVALTGHASAVTLMLGSAVALWTGGFDIIYSLQDIRFDRSVGLFSVPGRFGPAGALWLSRVSFIGMIALLAVIGVRAGLGWIYMAGVAIVATILATEHWLVRDARQDGHSKNLNAAFFNANASVSIVYFLFLALDRLVGLSL